MSKNFTAADFLRALAVVSHCIYVEKIFGHAMCLSNGIYIYEIKKAMSINKTVRAAALCLAAAFQWSAVAAPIVDQDNPERAGGFCYTDERISCGQSFRQDHTNISGAGIFIDPAYTGAPKGVLTLSIFGAYGAGGPSGLIASGSAANVNSASGWVDVFFTPAAVTAGLQYYLIVESTNHLVASYSSATNNYAKGHALAANASYPAFDLTFRTYFDDRMQQLPEPGAWALLAIGMAGVGVVCRKKRA